MLGTVQSVHAYEHNDYIAPPPQFLRLSFPEGRSPSQPSPSGVCFLAWRLLLKSFLELLWPPEKPHKRLLEFGIKTRSSVIPEFPT